MTANLSSLFFINLVRFTVKVWTFKISHQKANGEISLDEIATFSFNFLFQTLENILEVTSFSHYSSPALSSIMLAVSYKKFDSGVISQIWFS